MLLSTTLEKLFYHYVRNELGLFNIVYPEYFKNPEIKKCFSLDKEFYLKYKTLPSLSQLKTIISTEKENLGLSEDEIDHELNKINTIFGLNLDEYDEDYVKESVEAWITWQTLDTSFFDAITLMKNTKVDINNVSEIVNKVKQIILDRNSLSFDFSLGCVFSNPNDHYSEVRECFSSGYDYIDLAMGGGLRKGTLTCFVGSSGRGKSIWLSNMAVQQSKLGKHSAFISLEMGDTEVVGRIGSNILDVDINEYVEFSKNTIELTKRLKKYKRGASSISLNPPGEIYIKEFPTGSASVHDFETYLKKVEEITGIKFDVVIVDYINIALNWRNPNSDNTYMKIKQIAEDLRGMGQRNQWAVITATQLNRTASAASDVGPEGISESMGLLFTLDTAFAILQDEEQKAEEIFVLKNIKARNSRFLNSKRKFKINYSRMRITEDGESSIYNI